MFVAKVLVAGAAAIQTADVARLHPEAQIMNIFSGDELNGVDAAEMNSAFLKVYEHLAKEFPTHEYESFLKEMEQTLVNYQKSKAYNAYRTVPGQGQCETAGAAGPSAVKALSAFPGGITRRTFGFDLSKLVFDLAQKASGPAAASAAMVGPLAAAALSQGAASIQALMHTVVATVPPTIAPPAWKNSPLTCMPMVTGHNCAGAILHPITAADFVIADVTDASLDGVIAGFPALYEKKVGKTSDAAYRTCFNAYMSMKCASLFPRCAVPEARQEPGPAGKLGMCFTHCIATMVACPGFWIDDLKEECNSVVSVPPACTFATFLNSWRAPPQYVSYEESAPAPLECPSSSGFEGAEGTAGADYTSGAAASVKVA